MKEDIHRIEKLMEVDVKKINLDFEFFDKNKEDGKEIYQLLIAKSFSLASFSFIGVSFQ